jgi:hypothetical protein
VFSPVGRTTRCTLATPPPHNRPDPGPDGADRTATFPGGPPPLTALLDEQRRLWQEGQPARAEDLLARHPGLADDPEAVLELAYHEALLRERRGERPVLEEYLRRFPSLAGPLRAQFEVHGALGGLSRAGERTASANTLPPAEPPGCLPAIPGYEVLRELGRGGMGVVYLAQQHSPRRPVALKLLRDWAHASSAELGELRAEADKLARLQHPHVVTVYGTGEHGGCPFLVMQYLGGGSLGARLGGAPLPPAGAARLVEVLARALAAVHAAGVVHRDLKPSNVLFSEDGTPKVSDFSLAKRLDAEATLTSAGGVKGTPPYMAPEQAAGKRDVGPAADVYALGAVLYELLTGRPPFRGASHAETLMQVVSEEPVPVRRLRSGVPRDLETVCHKCLEKEPGKRYRSAQALADDLAALLAGRPVAARPVGALGRGWRWCRRNPAVAALAGSVLMLLAALLAGALASNARLQRQLALTERAEREKTDRLWDSYLAAARASRWSGRPGAARRRAGGRAPGGGAPARPPPAQRGGRPPDPAGRARRPRAATRRSGRQRGPGLRPGLRALRPQRPPGQHQRPPRGRRPGGGAPAGVRHARLAVEVQPRRAVPGRPLQRAGPAPRLGVGPRPRRPGGGHRRRHRLQPRQRPRVRGGA